jgi:thioredoxin 1
MQIVQSIQEFNDKLQKDKVMLINVGANWCRPCKTLKPLLEELSKSYPDIEFLKIDVDITPDISNALQIDSFPSSFLICGKNQSQIIKGADIKAIETLVSKSTEFESYCRQSQPVSIDPRGDKNCRPDENSIF